jgi:uncharacterized membrane protein
VDTNRTEAFSDGVFAIAITLLILEIRVPGDPPLGHALLGLWPSYVAYAISFIVIGAIWINHHLMFAKFEKADSVLLLYNLLALMTVAFLPFPTAVLAEAFHRGEGANVATAFYGGTLTVGGIFINLIWHHAARGRLLKGHVTAEEVGRIGRRYLVGPCVYAVAAIVGWFIPVFALLVYALLNLFYLWPRYRHQPPAAKS